MATGQWLITGSTTTELDGGGSRIDLEVAGYPLWFESPDAVLIPRPEAWITALALSAAGIDAELVLTEPLPDPAWLARVQDTIALTASWWGGEPRLEVRTLRPDPPDSSTRTDSDDPGRSAERGPAGLRGRIGGLRDRLRRRPAPAAAPGSTAAGSGRLVCFTGGLDSFFTLLTDPVPATHLLFVHGFDVALDDAARREAVSRTVRAVARERGVIPIEMATNLHGHPTFSSVSWERTHGAALAACGILLAGTVDQLVIPPSDAHSLDVPWGSRPDLDVRWSVPGLLEVIHGDGRGTRMDRLVAVADHPLVHRHLRVCWEHLNDDLNCGSCEKCQWITAALDALGRLSDSVTFRADPPPAVRLDTLARTQTKFFGIWRAVRDRSDDPALVAAIDRLLERSAAADRMIGASGDQAPASDPTQLR